ncbi:enterochelin esterase domain-containing protein [uncultured Rothia sp.]|uniref:enterochelin esterase domain-containing protein n=1 Tax=uncultured Rothia sp. TaxID=316088 RepID=UPI0028F015BD|nr:enterochelin esterase domain-containing protein [uncultured Rothia sp.]
MGQHEPTVTVPAQKSTSERVASTQPCTVAPAVRPTPPKTPRPVPAPRVDSPLISTLIAEAVSPEELNARILEVVSEGTPIIEPVRREDGSVSENERIVTFLYRNEQAEQVLMFINRLTDEKNLDRSLMSRIEGTGWWQLSMQMETTWRASYNFLPTLPGERPAWLGDDDQVRLRAALDSGEGDPLNPETVCNRIGRCMGVVQLEDAPVQDFILTQEEIDALPAPEWMQTPDGHKYVLGRVGDPAPDAPLFIQFDGEMWFSQGMEQTLNRAHEAGRIPAMHVFFLHSGGRENRWKELNGDNPIADYLVEVAFPHLEAVHGIKTDPQNIVINGQSLGGLSSLLAVLSRPEAFGGAIAQSSSLWQPQVMDRLDELEAAGEIDRLRHLYLEIEVGEQEWILVQPHRELKARLEKLGLEKARCTTFNGGHDYACWRGAIVPAMERIIAASREAEHAEQNAEQNCEKDAQEAA